MRRRTLMTGAAATAFAGLAGDAQARRPRRLGASDADRVQQAVVRLYALDYQHGGESLWQSALSQVSESYTMLENDSYSSTIEARLLKAAGRMQMCAGLKNSSTVRSPPPIPTTPPGSKATPGWLRC